MAAEVTWETETRWLDWKTGLICWWIQMMSSWRMWYVDQCVFFISPSPVIWVIKSICMWARLISTYLIAMSFLSMSKCFIWTVLGHTVRRGLRGEQKTANPTSWCSASENHCVQLEPQGWCIKHVGQIKTRQHLIFLRFADLFLLTM